MMIPFPVASMLIPALACLACTANENSRDDSNGIIDMYRDTLSSFKDLLHSDALDTAKDEGRLQAKTLLQMSDSRENCYILKLAESTEKETAERVSHLLAAIDAHVKGSLSDLMKAHIVCFKSASAPMRLLRAIKSVELIEKDKRVHVGQWATERITPKIKQKLAMPLTDPSAVHVYVVDTGIWTKHSEFDGKAKIGFSLVSSRFGEDCNGHGTQVASLIGGRTLGIAPGVTLIGVQAMDCDGSGSVGNMIRALEWIKLNVRKPAIVNMSFNGVKSDILDEAINGLVDFDVTVVAAAGNAGCDACSRSPSDASKAIIVGASDRQDRRAQFSNYGKCITIFAPGCNIIAASVPFTPKSMFAPQSSFVEHEGRHPEDRFVVTSGTSFAAPFVTGSLALMLASNSTSSPRDLKTRLVSASQSNVLSPDSLNNSPNLLLQLPY